MAFTDKEFTYGDVTFRVDKLLPQEAKAVFMAHVRPLLEGALSVESGGGDGLAMILGIVAKAPQTHYDAVMRALYQHVYYTSPDQVQPQRLAGDEERAFANLDMAHLLLVDARAFAVNFSRVLGRTPIGVPVPIPDYSVATSGNIDPFFYHPVKAGLVGDMSQYKMRGEDGDPLHELADVCDYNESLIFDAVNQERQQKKASDRQAAAQRRRR